MIPKLEALASTKKIRVTSFCESQELQNCAISALDDTRVCQTFSNVCKTNSFQGLFQDVVHFQTIVNEAELLNEISVSYFKFI